MGPLLARTNASASPGHPSRGGVAAGGAPDFDAVYEAHFAYVWRAARRLGIDPANTDDVVQEVFVVAHRKLSGFEGRSQVKTWLFKILVHVVRHHVRAQQRKPGHRPAAGPAELDGLLDHDRPGPADAVERAEAVRVLDRLLGELDDDKREVFVLAEIEQLSCVEIAEVLGANVNTVYSRLRAARLDFERAVARFHTHEFGGQP